MPKLLIKLILILSLCISHTTWANTEKEEVQSSELSYFNLAKYSASALSYVLTYMNLQYKYGRYTLSGMGLLFAYTYLKKSNAGPSKTTKTEGQIMDLGNFKDRFDVNGRRIVCKGSTIGGIWMVGHAALKLQLADHKSYDEEDSLYLCKEYYFDRSSGKNGVNVETSGFGKSFEVSITKEEEEILKKWLVEEDRKSNPWTPSDNCIDFIFNALKSVGHEAEILPWLARVDTGMTLTKVSLMKYLWTEKLKNPTTSLRPSLDFISITMTLLCDFILNPVYAITLGLQSPKSIASETPLND